MANEERTEQPTQKRKEESRRKGQVAHSTEVNSALILLATLVTIKSLGGWLSGRGLLYTERILSMMGSDWNENTFNQLLTLSAAGLAELVLPILGVALAAGIVAGLAQTGLLFLPELAAPKLERINPVQGLQRIFSRRSLVELLKSLAKIGVAGYLAYGVVRSNLDTFPRLIGMGVPQAVAAVGNLGMTVIYRVGIFLVILAAADYLFQYNEMQKSIRMTKQELKEELRQTEGDPLIKGKIRQRQRQMAMRRMMQQVPQADVVITNPTHYAVALGYDPVRDQAPRVLAKGADQLALKIKAIAEEHQIIIYQDPPLARTLYTSVEIGETIPEELYEAVANILAFVYRLRPGYLKRKRKGQ